MSKSFEALPDFDSTVEMVTFLRVLADDIEQGKIYLTYAEMSKHWEISHRGIKLAIETQESRL